MSNVEIQTSLGNITIELDTKNTPETAKNFLSYVNDKFYDGTIFHRVIDGFMVQGGGFEPGMKQKACSNPIKNEAKKCQSNKTGTVAMARTMDPHSATAQFFINVKDNDFLNFSSETPQGWGYCTFAKVTAGMDVVEKIKAVKTGSKAGHEDVPVDDVIIKSMKVV